MFHGGDMNAKKKVDADKRSLKLSDKSGQEMLEVLRAINIRLELDETPKGAFPLDDVDKVLI